MATKIYKNGNQIAIEQNGIVHNINATNFVYNKIGISDTMEFRDTSIPSIYNEAIANVQNQAGDAIGDFDAIQAYLDAITHESLLGAAQFADSVYTEENPLLLSTNVPIDLPNNKGNVLILQDIEGVGDWIDNTGLITPPNGNGDGYTLRGTFVVNADLNNKNLLITIDIGAGTPILAETKILARANSDDTRILFVAPFYTLGTFLANGGRIKVECNADVSIYNINFYLYRNYKGTNV